MTGTRTTDIRAILGGGAEGDRVAVTHFVVGALFLVAGSLLAVLSLASLRFAGLSLISFGRLEPMANLVLLLGFGVISLVGGVYYVLPRLTGVRLWNPRLAGLGLLGTAGLVLLGVVVIGLGLGSGRQPFSLPWWIDLPMVGVLAVPFLVTARTIAEREEKHSYVTIWFVLGGVTWLPLLYAAYAAGHSPFLTPVAMAYNDMFLAAGLVTMVVMTLGTGVFYYTVVRELDVPLASRTLAAVGFWSLGLASVWWGTAQLIFGPGPGWLAGVAAALGLAFPIGAVANAASVSLTLEGSWSRLGDHPGVSAGVYGLFLAAGVGALAAIAGFRSVAAVATLTSFWEAVEYTAIAGVGVLLVAGVSFAALPRLIGRDMPSPRRARSFIRLTLIGSIGVLVFLTAAGLVSGYSWIAGSNSGAYVDAGEGWGAGAGPVVDTFLLFALGASLIAFLGHAAYASTILGTVVRGPARTQEMLVTVEQSS